MRSRLPISALALVLLSSCTAARVGEDRLAERDPLEGFNRGVWGFNQAVDKVLLKPVTQVYRAVLPRPVRRGVTHFFANVGEPFSAVNNLLQGHPDRAARNLKRFVVNTTVGVAGLGDPATKMGIKPAPEDFGQTLAAWGVNGGPYLVLPIFGPSTLRDGVGQGVGQLADPYNVCLRECDFVPSGVPLAATAAYAIDTRSNLIDAGADAFLKSSADPYATARSAFLQRRRAAILNRDDEATASAAPSDDAALNAAVSELDGADGTPPDDASTPATKSAPGPSGEAPAAGASGGSGDAGLDAALSDIDQQEAGSGTGAADPQAAPAPAPTAAQ